jgi:hypothetical protein
MYPIDILEIYRAKSFPKFDMEADENHTCAQDTKYKMIKIYPEPFNKYEEGERKKPGLYECPYCRDEAAYTWRPVTTTTTISSMRAHLTREHASLVKVVRGHERVPHAAGGQRKNNLKQREKEKEKEISHNTNDSDYA